MVILLNRSSRKAIYSGQYSISIPTIPRIYTYLKVFEHLHRIRTTYLEINPYWRLSVCNYHKHIR